jgi:hypothetical protein
MRAYIQRFAVEYRLFPFGIRRIKKPPCSKSVPAISRQKSAENLSSIQ